MASLTKTLINVSALAGLVSICMLGGYYLVEKSEIEPRKQEIAAQKSEIEELNKKYIKLTQDYVILSEKLQVTEGVNISNLLSNKLSDLEVQLISVNNKKQVHVAKINQAKLKIANLSRLGDICKRGNLTEKYQKWCRELSYLIQNVQNLGEQAKDYEEIETFLRGRIINIEKQLIAESI